MDRLTNLKDCLLSVKIVTLYFLLLHFLILTIVFTPNLASKISKVLGKEHPNDSVIYNYQSTKTMLKRIERNLNKNNVLFIGDSLTQGMAVNSIAPYAVNFGIGHDTINGVLERIRSYKSMNKVATVIIAVGINDLRKLSLETSLSRYYILLNELKELPHVYIHGVLPIDKKILGRVLQNKITLFNRELFKLTQEFGSIQYLKVPSELFDSNRSLKTTLHLGDGLHLNKKGYDIWINQLKTQLNNQ
jgi:lysophospholipase L1-like esterase